MNPLYRQTVTIYHKNGDVVTKREETDCYYHFSDCLVPDGQGVNFRRKFLLIQPGEDPIHPGDKVLLGRGPDITRDDWDTVLPDNTPTLSVVEKVTQYLMEGELLHWEAEG